MKMKNYDVQQYVVENLVVAENHKYRKNIYTDFLVNNSTSRETDRLSAEQHLNTEVQKLLSKFNK